MRSAGVGGIALGILTVTSEIDSTTRAQIGALSTVSASGGNVDVVAISVNAAEAITQSFSAGGVTFDKSDPKAEVTATTEALLSVEPDRFAATAYARPPNPIAGPGAMRQARQSL